MFWLEFNPKKQNTFFFLCSCKRAEVQERCAFAINPPTHKSFLISLEKFLIALKYIFIAIKSPEVCVFLSMLSLCSVRYGGSLYPSFLRNLLASRKPLICSSLPRNNGSYPLIIRNWSLKGSLGYIRLQISNWPQLGLSVPTNPPAHSAA